MYYKSFQELWAFLHGKYVEIKPKEYKPRLKTKAEAKEEEPKAEPKKKTRKKKEE